jgi:hypothetical protein
MINNDLNEPAPTVFGQRENLSLISLMRNQGYVVSPILRLFCQNSTVQSQLSIAYCLISKTIIYADLLIENKSIHQLVFELVL